MRRVLALALLPFALSACSLRQVAMFYHEPVSKVTPVQQYVAAVWENRFELNRQSFLVCTRAHESDSAGGYQAYNRNGPYYGAYQFTQSTWDNTARRSGQTALIGARITQVSWWDQDSLAWILYSWQGNVPWGGRC